MKISSELFGNYLKCRYKAHLKASGLAGHPGDYDQLKERLAKQHKERGFLNGFYEYNFRDESQRMMVNHSVLKEGKSLIVKAVIMAEEVEAECDVLQRVDEESSLGDFCYFPVLLTVAERISKHDKLMLGFTGMALAALQGKPVEYGNIIYGKNYKTCRVNLSRDIAKVKDLFESIKQVASTEQASQMMLNNHCRICEYRDHCLAQAKEKDHLSLISGMSVKEITRLNNKGTFTVTQYAYTFRARRTKTKSKDKFRRFDLQALAIRDKKIYVLQTPKMPESKTSIYVDIEGDPDRNFYYLIGMLVVRDSTMVHHFFWADTENDELDIAARFFEQLHTCDEYSLFHYGAYETKFLKRMKERLNGVHKGVIDQATARAFNVLDSIYSTVYFPTYSNGLKEIGRYLGCNWTDENASGLQSIVWRHEWETHKDDGLKTQLIRYNCEDCLALEKVVGFLSKLQHTDKNEDQTNPTFAYASSLAASYPYKKFRKINFCIPAMDYINRCAYFDYQHDKVSLARSVSKVARKRMNRAGSTLLRRVNKIVFLARPAQCPKCGSKKVYANQIFGKRVTDLIFSGVAVKRWTVQYRSKQYRCSLCHGTFSNQDFLGFRRYGHGLVSWVVYFNVALNLPLNRIRSCLADLFGISLSRALLLTHKKGASSYYQPAYMELISAVRNSDVIYADETQLKIGRETHYIWVFTNSREVVFAYSASREGGFLREFLGGFKGVLVSDFYAPYDSINCPQQKCLIHLIRDMNDDLLANPFDEVFKQMIQAFTILLRAIVETIDQYGLKKRYLQRHKAAVDGFYTSVLKGEFQSEVARKYQKRFDKNQEKLFTFLEYDRVSWNNNDAEHAIKHFATYRRIQQGASTPVTIQQHLVLLSIFQTCKYRNIPFLKFLLSKELDIGSMKRRRVRSEGQVEQSREKVRAD